MKIRKSIFKIYLVASCVLVILGAWSPVFAEPPAGTTESMKPPLDIVNKTGIKVVAQINSAEIFSNGVNRQVMGVKNLFDNYTSSGMLPGKDFEIVMVFRGDGGSALLNDDAYAKRVAQQQATGNPNRGVLEAMSKGGVKMYECSMTMKGRGYRPEDLFPFSRVVVTGIGAIVDLEKSGYLQITP
ncbi:MAG TPA: DsrE family protein [Nitrospirota bacterium]|nr:DsrE family protein [Nitrospirota bacterium]